MLQVTNMIWPVQSMTTASPTFRFRTRDSVDFLFWKNLAHYKRIRFHLFINSTPNSIFLIFLVGLCPFKTKQWFYYFWYFWYFFAKLFKFQRCRVNRFDTFMSVKTTHYYFSMVSYVIIRSLLSRFSTWFVDRNRISLRSDDR